MKTTIGACTCLTTLFGAHDATEFHAKPTAKPKFPKFTIIRAAGVSSGPPLLTARNARW
eukprot:CAMPEP_0176307204 /NCGR_PEP_ID=MMETSP0121_2-20121125/63891_1 /TAXON_ID=160619 /ORGANISM="Kryptoperidinium foliaceum, Strain CCMP 1326" /LENGTH=58 /DNA_ID=CAMNT_0017648965 /DNA_START=101 /DNA_END=277 /DNA_ORIENTATION=-